MFFYLLIELFYSILLIIVKDISPIIGYVIELNIKSSDFFQKKKIFTSYINEFLTFIPKSSRNFDIFL